MIADGEEQVAVARLHDAAAEVVAARRRPLLLEDHLARRRAAAVAVDQPRARQRGLAAAARPARRSRNRSCRSSRTRGRGSRRAVRPGRARTPCGTPATGGDSLPSLRDDAHAARPLGDQHAAVGKEGDRPGIGEAAGHGLDGQIVRGWAPDGRNCGWAFDGSRSRQATAVLRRRPAISWEGLLGRRTAVRPIVNYAPPGRIPTYTTPEYEKITQINANSHFPLWAVRHDGGQPTHRQQQQSDQQRDGERRRIAVGTNAEDVGARDPDRHGGGRDDRRQCKRDGCDQLHQGNGPRAATPLSGGRSVETPPSQSWSFHSPAKISVVLVARIAGMPASVRRDLVAKA